MVIVPGKGELVPTVLVSYGTGKVPVVMVREEGTSTGYVATGSRPVTGVRVVLGVELRALLRKRVSFPGKGDPGPTVLGR